MPMPNCRSMMISAPCLPSRILKPGGFRPPYFNYDYLAGLGLRFFPLYCFALLRSRPVFGRGLFIYGVNFSPEFEEKVLTKELNLIFSLVMNAFESIPTDLIQFQPREFTPEMPFESGEPKRILIICSNSISDFLSGKRKI